VKGDRRVGPAARDIFVDRLTNARFKLSEVSRQINYYIALLSVHRIELHAEFSSGVDHLSAAVSGHASHNCVQKVMPEKRSTFNGKQRKRNKGGGVEKQSGIHYARL
jgi:hypothetical protein